jgi:hypothetical protein
MVADYLKIAVAEVASISERRIDRLTDGRSSKLPPGVQLRRRVRRRVAPRASGHCDADPEKPRRVAPRAQPANLSKPASTVVQIQLDPFRDEHPSHQYS